MTTQHPIVRMRGVGGAVAASLFGLSALSGTSFAETENPFDALLGSWKGTGDLDIQKQQAEKIRCNAYYTGGGSKLKLAIRCASSSYQVRVRSSLTKSGNVIKGTWEERTYNASGTASGMIEGKTIKINVEGGGFTGRMAVEYDRTKQTVAITTDGITMKALTLELQRAKPRN